MTKKDNHKLWELWSDYGEYTENKDCILHESARIDKEIRLLETRVSEGKLTKAEIEQRELLDRQLAAMRDYVAILDQRWSLLWDRCEEIAEEIKKIYQKTNKEKAMGMIRNENGMKFYYQQITDGENVIGHFFSFAAMYEQLQELIRARKERNDNVSTVLLKIEPPEDAKMIRITHERYYKGLGNSFCSQDHHIDGAGQYTSMQLEKMTCLCSFVLPIEWTPDEIQQLIAELSQCSVEYNNVYYGDEKES